LTFFDWDEHKRKSGKNGKTWVKKKTKPRDAGKCRENETTQRRRLSATPVQQRPKKGGRWGGKVHTTLGLNEKTDQETKPNGSEISSNRRGRHQTGGGTKS